jgi:hypothetical protein
MHVTRRTAQGKDEFPCVLSRESCVFLSTKELETRFSSWLINVKSYDSEITVCTF